MKRALLILLTISTIIYASCKKTIDGPGEIYGKWRLTETLNDPGDGSGRYEKVKGPAKYLTLDKAGRFEGDAVPELQTFKVLDSIRLEVTLTTLSKPITYYYKVSATTLILNPPCFEGCGLKFVRQ